MRNSTRTLFGSLAAALLLAPVAASAQGAVARGDTERGGRIFRMECSSCHGADGSGSNFWKAASQGKNLGSIPDLRDSAFLAQRSDGDLRKAIRKGMGRNGWIPGHTFASLSTLDTWDVVQWIRDGSLTVAQFFPEAASFTAKDFQIDKWGAERLAENLKLQLGQKELEVVVLTVYKGQKDPNAGVRLVPWKPVELDLLKAGDRLGFLSFADLEVPGGKETIRVGLSFGTDGKFRKAVVNHPDAKLRADYEKALNAFAGQGGKGIVIYKAPKGLKDGEAWARELTRAASVSAEGITMFEKAERSRTAFDR